MAGLLPPSVIIPFTRRTWNVRNANRPGSQPCALVTGSCGLIGSEVSLYFSRRGFQVVGIDNNQRAVFFGPAGDTSWVLGRLQASIPGYKHHSVDIRDRETILHLIADVRPSV